MARPQRIEFNQACYYVSSQGRGNKILFPGREYRKMFLELFDETCDRFNVDMHAYCILKNEYHLLLNTRNANLSRVMRYLNGVYTQRYNSSRFGEGPLFYGRYKATVIDPENYLERVGRYIHCLPKYAGCDIGLEESFHSSIAHYLGEGSTPRWLKIISAITDTGSGTHNERYARYVANCTDVEVRHFFERKKRPPVLGSADFQEKMRTTTQGIKKNREGRDMRNYFVRPEIDNIVNEVAREYELDSYALYRTQEEEKTKKVILARNVAMTLSQDIGGHTLKDIASVFGIKNYRSVSILVGRFKNLINNHDSLRSQYVELRMRLLSRC
jgi:REP-associated tyrosine transposase